MTRYLETDTQTNMNISAAVAVASYTADADRLILVQLLLNQVAGSGDYVFYLTLILSGTFTEYIMLPKTTGTAAVGETSIGGQSIQVPVRSGDVLMVYVDGLAADIATPDVTVRFFEVGENDLLVDAVWDELIAGHLGAGTTGEALDDVPSAADNADAVWDEALAGHLGAGSTGEALDDVPTVGENADAVWDELLAGHLGAGSTGEALDDASAATIFPAGAINFTYTVTNSVTLLPIEGVEVWFSTDNPAVNIVWKGDTDAFGVARDVNGALPALDAGAYFVWRQKAGFIFTDPDLENVS